MTRSDPRPSPSPPACAALHKVSGFDAGGALEMADAAEMVADR